MVQVLFQVGQGSIPACAGSSARRFLLRGRGVVHPRVRGEQCIGKLSASPSEGPSPRARGAVVVGEAGAGVLGSIPACAGSRVNGPYLDGRGRVHPRVRGEQPRIMRHTAASWGPSPRARGAGHLDHRGVRSRGSIPACAGSRPGPGGCPLVRGVHPRVRGEQGVADPNGGTVAGPSPRARGADAPPCLPVRGAGSIPACAGSSMRFLFCSLFMGVHPRVRGEQPRAARARLASLGPSPRARGAGTVGHLALAGLGSIPACAGSSWWEPSACPVARVHPRVRGEQVGQGLAPADVGGPSPRARGAGGDDGGRATSAGSIPACAGSRFGPRPWPRGRWVHPRVRGEQANSSAQGMHQMGPSPRARGAGPVPRGAQLGGGSIPACAGSSLADLQLHPENRLESATS
ncbi:Putative membrane protein, clustering with ActP [Nocardiopsis sp. JB363]|nr:Putative membrane protein, clustering with ActP [Nocardiopsis sp. JB363]